MGVTVNATVKINLKPLQQFQNEINNQLNGTSQGPITKAFKQWGVRFRSYLKERFDTYSKGGGDWPPLAESTKLQRRGPRGSSKSKADGRAKAGKLRKRINKLGQQLVNLNRKPAKRGKTIKTANRRKKILEQIKKAKLSFKKNKSLKGRKFAILRDTGTLFAALSPTFTNKPGSIEENIPGGIRVGYGGTHSYPKGKGKGKGKSKATIADIASFHQEGKGRLPVRKIIVPPTKPIIDAMENDMQRAINSIIKTI